MAQAAEWAKRGHTLVRVGLGGGYGNSRDALAAGGARAINRTRALLDEYQRLGLHAMLEVGAGTPPGDDNATALAAFLEGVEAAVAPWREHPALAAYYVCDDCCKGADFTRNMAAAYDAYRAADPYHLTAGAFECAELHAFQEPYLSTDLPMRENYRPDLPSHAPEPARGGGGDGALRLPPLTFEPVVNMPQPCRQFSPAAVRAEAWVGVATGDLWANNW